MDQNQPPRSRSRLFAVVGLLALVALVIGVRQLSSKAEVETVGVHAASSSGDMASTPQAPAPTVRPVRTLAEVPAGPADHLEVIYFHRTARCESCNTAERLSRLTVGTLFAEDLESGKVTYSVVDVQQAPNAAVAERYGAYGPSLYLGIFKGDTQYIWHASDTYVALNSDSAFVSILSDRISTALGVEG